MRFQCFSSLIRYKQTYLQKPWQLKNVKSVWKVPLCLCNLCPHNSVEKPLKPPIKILESIQKDTKGKTIKNSTALMIKKLP